MYMPHQWILNQLATAATGETLWSSRIRARMLTEWRQCAVAVREFGSEHCRFFWKNSTMLPLLPHELYREIFSFCTSEQLTTLCLTSRLFNEIGFPILYREINFCSEDQVLGFADSLQHSGRMELVRIVRMCPFASSLSNSFYDQTYHPFLHFHRNTVCRSFTEDSFSRVTRYAQALQTISEVLPTLQNLEVLQMYILPITSGEPPHIWHHQFRNMVSFSFGNVVKIDRDLISFLNHHPTLLHLTFHCEWPGLLDFPKEPIPQIKLPNLQTFQGPAEIFRTIVTHSPVLTAATLEWGTPGAPAASADIINALAKSPAKTCRKLVCRRAHPVELLESLSSIYPHVVYLSVHPRWGPDAEQQFLRLSYLRHPLSSLRSLKTFIFHGNTTDEPLEEILNVLGSVCPSLLSFQIGKLHIWCCSQRDWFPSSFRSKGGTLVSGKTLSLGQTSYAVVHDKNW